MRVFALSDIHVDFEANAKWVEALSCSDYRNDVLVLAGDVSDSLTRLASCLDAFVRRFRKVFFVPGNHDLWVVRDPGYIDSLDKFAQVMQVAEASGVCTRADQIEGIVFVPLLGWYDGSFGALGPDLLGTWMDFHFCRWPKGWTNIEISEHFISCNKLEHIVRGRLVISFSHFLPRIDVMPFFIPSAKKKIYPVLGSDSIEALIRQLRSDIHIYGHSHVNRNVCKDGVRYVNNAFAYPYEDRIARKTLMCIYGNN